MYCVAISHPNFFRGLFEAVVPEAIVNPLPHQFQRRLGTILIFGRHVEIVQESK